MLINSLSSGADASALRDRISTLSRELVEGRRADAYQDTRTLGLLSGAHETLRSVEGTTDRATADLARLDMLQLATERAALAIHAAASDAIDGGSEPDFGSLARDLIDALEGWHGNSPLIGGLPAGGLIPSMVGLATGLQTEIATAPDPAAGLAAAKAWLAPGGAAEAAGLIRRSDPVILEGAGEVVLAGDDANLRNEIAILLTGTVADLNADEALGRLATEALAVSDNLERMAGRIGYVEAQVERARDAARLDADRAEGVIAEGIGIDAYAKAAALRDGETQLETLYTLTGRLARLSLANYV